MKRLAVCLVFLVLFSCARITPVRYRQKLHYDPSGKKKTGKSIALGPLFDQRFVGKKMPVDVKQIKISMEEIRRILASFLQYSRRFEKVVVLLPKFSGENLAELLNSARKSDCDYLLVGEVSHFDIKFYGLNWRIFPSLALDFLILPLNLIVFVITAGGSLVFTGGLVAVAMVEVRLSLILNLFDVRTGQIVHTFTPTERVRNPATSFQMMGYFYDSSDDWLDLGRRLGDDTIHNMAVKLVDPIADRILKHNRP